MIRLPGNLLETIEDAARRAFPREACGLLVGREMGEGVTVTRFAESANLAPGDARDRFELDARLHLRLQRELRASAESILGVFHSHPSGRAEPSQVDRARAEYPGWVWLITAVDAALTCETRAFRHCRAGGFTELALARADSAAAGR